MHHVITRATERPRQDTGTGTNTSIIRNTGKARTPARVLCALLAAAGMLIAPMTATAAETARPAPTITGLTTDYLTDPVGVETDGVTFGWRMDSKVIGATQSAYQIDVTADGKGTVWSSGKTDGGTSVGIPYAGPDLTDGTAYSWTVTVWDGDGAKAVSSPATFETGVTDAKQWQDAQFIRMNKSSSAPIFRTERKVGSDIVSARLYITALGAYQAYLNGKEVGETQADGTVTHDHMNPGYGNGDVSLGYQTYDVTGYLKGQRDIALSVVAGNGWKFGLNTTAAQPAVKALLAVTGTDGDVTYIPTNTTDWKGTLSGGILKNGVYYGEDYDARVADRLGDFTKVGYDDGDWTGADNTAATVVPKLTDTFDTAKARYVRLSVSATGPAIKEDTNENRLQIMEMGLYADGDGTGTGSGTTNLLKGLTAQASDTFDWDDTWGVAKLTDGDDGVESDAGYSSGVLANNQSEVALTQPITLTFDLGEAKSFDRLTLQPRVQADSIDGVQAANYPKDYTLQISDDGEHWTDVTTKHVDSLRNTVLHPQTAMPAVTTSFDETTAKDVRVSVSQSGPANAQDNENRLQIMEMQLTDADGDVVSGGVTPTVSDTFTGGDQWKPANLTDGDLGETSDAGWSSGILGKGNVTQDIDEPITFDFHFDKAVSIAGLTMTPRTKVDSILSGTATNYPQTYSVQVSKDGGKTWTDVKRNVDAGSVRNTVLAGALALGTTTYAGKIVAKPGLTGRIVDAFSAEPVSATVYEGDAATSEFAGGQVNVVDYRAYAKPSDALYQSAYTNVAKGDSLFGKNGLTLKKGQTIIIDMGQNLTAVPTLTFAAASGTKATVRFGEMLNDGSAVGNGNTQADGPKGSMYQKNLRNARSQATYVFDGNGKETYQPLMSYFGYQYIELTATADMTVYAAKSNALSSVSRQTGTISTDNEHVNKLFSNTLHGQLSNYYTTSTDCPQRDERLLWTGDLQAFAQTATYNFDSVAFLDDIQDILDENTMIKGYTPSVADQLSGYFSNQAAGWSDALIIDAWVMYQQTGDASILSRSYEALTKYMDFMIAGERGPDQARVTGDKNFGDWLSFQGTNVNIMADYYYGYDAQLMAKIAGVLGKSDDEARYAAKFEAIKAKFLATHVTFTDGTLTIKSGDTASSKNQFQMNLGKGGTWEDNSQTALLWMLKLGFYDSDAMREAATKLLVDNIRNENPAEGSVRASMAKNSLAVGFLGANVIAPTLTDAGQSSVSYDLLLNDAQPSWLFEVNAGATTIWERWNSYTPGVGFGDSEMNSFNHYAYGAVVEWMYRYMAGIASSEDAPGFKHIVLQPTIDTGDQYNDESRISHAKGTYDSYYGTIASEWTSTGKGSASTLKTYKATVPANTTATLYLPVAESAAKGFKGIAGVTYKGMTEHNGVTAARFELASGGYTFAVRDGVLSAAIADGYTASSGETNPNQPDNPNQPNQPGDSGDGDDSDGTGTGANGSGNGATGSGANAADANAAHGTTLSHSGAAVAVAIAATALCAAAGVGLTVWRKRHV